MVKYINNTTAQAMINGFKSKFGNNSALKTTSKNFVGAINELKLAIANLPQPQPDIDHVASYPVTFMVTNDYYDANNDTIIHDANGSVITMIDDDRCAKWTYDKKLCYSDDNGNSWNNSNYNGGSFPSGAIITGIVKLPDGSVITTSGFKPWENDNSVFAGASYISTDNGANWSMSDTNIGWLYKTDNYIVRFRKSSDNLNVFVEISTDNGNTWVYQFTVSVKTSGTEFTPHINKHSDGSITIRYSNVASSGWVNYLIYISNSGNEAFYYTSWDSYNTMVGDIIKYNNNVYFLYNKKIYKSTSIPDNKRLQTSNAEIVTIQDSNKNSVQSDSALYKFDIIDQNLTCAYIDSDRYISTDDGNTFVFNGIQMPDMPSSVSQYDIKSKIYFNNKWIAIVREDNNLYSYVYTNGEWNRYNIFKSNDKIFKVTGVSTDHKGTILTIQQWLNEYSSLDLSGLSTYKIGNKLIVMNKRVIDNYPSIFGYKYSEDGITWQSTGDTDSVFQNSCYGNNDSNGDIGDIIYILARKASLTKDGYTEPDVGYNPNWETWEKSIIKIN